MGVLAKKTELNREHMRWCPCCYKAICECCHRYDEPPMTDFGNKCIRCERIVCDNCFNKETGRCKICERKYEETKEKTRRKIVEMIIPFLSFLFLAILLWDLLKGRKVWDYLCVLMLGGVIFVAGPYISEQMERRKTSKKIRDKINRIIVGAHVFFPTLVVLFALLVNWYEGREVKWWSYVMILVFLALGILFLIPPRRKNNAKNSVTGNKRPEQ